MKITKHPRVSLKSYKGYKVKIVDPPLLRDYSGMNHYAAIEIGFTPIPDEDEILIEKSSIPIMKQTILHEVTEAELMKRGMKYWNAHKIALTVEKRLKKERK